MNPFNRNTLSALVLAFVMPQLGVAQDAYGPENDSKKFNVNEPLVTERQYFTYKGMNSSNVTLKSFKAFDCHTMRTMLGDNPTSALDHLGMMILVSKALTGVDIQTMPMQERENLVISTIAQELRDAGMLEELEGFINPKADQPRRIPTTNALCSILEELNYKMTRAHYNQRPLLSNPNKHTNG